MNYDEFAFFNQQLAAMLRDGLPLEGALKQLSADMKNEPLRREIEQLENDLARGVPLKDAISKRQLPDLYRRLIEIGARSNDLPGVLTLIADHYQRAGTLWNRLKGLMVYPLIVILVSLGLTLILCVLCSKFLGEVFAGFSSAMPIGLLAGMWVSPVVFAIAAVIGLAMVLVPSLRARMRWRLPAFREASLAQLASAISLMLKNGVSLPESLALAESLESNSPAARALGYLRQLVESGQGKPSHWPATVAPFPPMFLWLVRKGGEDPASGFQKAADLYHSRASYRIELALYGALPVSILLLGMMIFWQVMPLVRGLTVIMNALGGMGD